MKIRMTRLCVLFVVLVALVGCREAFNYVDIGYCGKLKDIVGTGVGGSGGLFFSGTQSMTTILFEDGRQYVIKGIPKTGLMIGETYCIQHTNWDNTFRAVLANQSSTR